MLQCQIMSLYSTILCTKWPIYLQNCCTNGRHTVSLKMILLLLHSSEAWHTPFRPAEAHIAKTETEDRRWSGPLGCQECWTRMRLSLGLDSWLSIDDLDCELGEEYLVCSPCCSQCAKTLVESKIIGSSREFRDYEYPNISYPRKW